jgi:hypothetical protein
MCVVHAIAAALIASCCGLTVGRRAEHAELVSLPEDLRRKESVNGLPTGEPGCEGWHLKPDIFSQQLFKGRHVGGLKGRYVPIQERPHLRFGRFGEVVLDWCRLSELCAGTLQCAVDRGGRGAQKLGDLACLPCKDVSQDEYGALPRWQMLQGRDES